MATRSPEERKADALAKLAVIEANAWVASTSAIGAVHLVPVTHTWKVSRPSPPPRPRTASGDDVYLVLGPERVQVWREAEDLAGRTVMRNGEWVI